jgi:hypothetical protein
MDSAKLLHHPSGSDQGSDTEQPKRTDCNRSPSFRQIRPDGLIEQALIDRLQPITRDGALFIGQGGGKQ